MTAINLKSLKQYKILSLTVVNSTNDVDGQKMILYCGDSGKLHVMETKEFHLKFKLNKHN